MSSEAPKTLPSDRGVIYVACGRKYRHEAAVSLASLRATNPGLEAWLLSDEGPEEDAGWDKVVVDEGLARLRNRAKLHMDRAPWERCLFLDTDTLVTGDLSDGFALLERFEFAGHMAGGGHHYRLPGLPPSFAEVNSGVLFWRRSARCDALFARWRALYDEFDQSGEARNWDQKSLRLALWESELRIAWLPANFNLMPYAPSVLERGLVVAHGRNIENLQRLEKRMGASDEMRAYVPGLGALRHPKLMSWREIVRTTLRLLALKLR